MSEAQIPAGYTLLKYLESSGTQHIDTGFKPNQDTRVVFDGYNTSASSSWFFGVWGGATNVKGFGTSFKYCSYASNNTAFASQIGVGELQIDQNKNTYTVNGTSGSYTAETFSSGYPLYLFALNKAGTKGGAFYGRMYSCQIYDNGTLVRDYTPCINPMGEYGLYDTVGKKFYGNAGTGTFIGSLADELPEGHTLLEYIESNGTQYIDTDFVPNSNVRVLMNVEGYSATEDPNTCLFGSNSSSSDYFRLIVTSGKLYRSYFGSAMANFASTVDYTGRTIVDFNKNVCTIGDSSVTATASTFNGTQSLYLFANNTSGSAVIPTSAKLYSCQIYDNGTLVRDYIPCINASGEYGLYDKLNKKFYGNAGSGSFTGEFVPLSNGAIITRRGAASKTSLKVSTFIKPTITDSDTAYAIQIKFSKTSSFNPMVGTYILEWGYVLNGSNVHRAVIKNGTILYDYDSYGTETKPLTLTVNSSYIRLYGHYANMSSKVDTGFLMKVEGDADVSNVFTD